MRRIAAAVLAVAACSVSSEPTSCATADELVADGDNPTYWGNLDANGDDVSCEGHPSEARRDT